jgi:DNA-binding NarL/FixJ family response regulator
MTAVHGLSPPPGAPIRVAVVEDDRATREGLAMLIGGSPGFACKETFRSVEDAAAGLPVAGVDVILLDIHLPGVLGSRGAANLAARCPGAAIVMLTVYEEEDLIFESLCNGAVGYLLKRTPPAQLLEAIREALHGGAPMSPEIARKVIAAFRGRMQPKPEAALTEQEVRLLKLLSEGKSYQACAQQLNVAVDTVRNYIRSVYRKLQVHSRSAAVAVALRSGLI